MNLLLVGDTHFKDTLSYADYIPDGRASEKRAILDLIIKSANGCDGVVLLGDCFHSKNPTSETMKDFVAFIEAFGNKEVFIISGNHSKKGDGSTALDFLKEVKNKPNWHLFTRPGTFPMAGLKLDFLPFMMKQELGVETSTDASKEIMKGLKGGGGNILFTHHMISDTSSLSELVDEPILPKNVLEKTYSMILAGHIHKPGRFGKTVLCGSVFTAEAGEERTYVYRLDTEKLVIEEIPLPSRPIMRLENPTDKQLEKIPDYSIIKVILTDPSRDSEELRKYMKRFDASLLIEDYPSTRKKIHMVDGAFDFSISNLLKIYAEERDVSYDKLSKGMELLT